MAKVSSVCVYCGSRFGDKESYTQVADDLGAGLAKRGIKLVYGGGGIGLMGTVARAALEAGGHVYGVIPDHLYRREVAQNGLSELEVVDTMHTRKGRMVERSDAFIVLPGGIGTLDELVEILTWRQLGLHDKPVVLLDLDGYWRPFANLLDHLIGAGFIDAAVHDYYRLVPDIAGAFEALEIA